MKADDWLMVIGYWRTLSEVEVLLVISYWLLVIGYWRTLSAVKVLLVIGYWRTLSAVLLDINFHKL